MAALIGRTEQLSEKELFTLEAVAVVFLHKQFTWKSAVGVVLITAGTLFMIL